ncbi:MAG: carboxypeptidase-like regulatory domain-containing protein [Paludibacter sp.]
MKTINKNQIKSIILLVGCVFFASQLFAEGTFSVKGRVLNSQKQTVNSASATLQNSETLEIVGGTMCDENGEFKIDNVKVGEYILTVHKPGFNKSDARRIHIDEDGVIIEKERISFNALNNRDIKLDTTKQYQKDVFKSYFNI